MTNKQHLKILAVAQLQSTFFLFIGGVCGMIYAFGGLLIDTLVSLGWASSEYWSTPGLSYGSILAMGALIGMPMIFGSIGFLLGIVEALLYNAFIAPFYKYKGLS